MSTVSFRFVRSRDSIHFNTPSTSDSPFNVKANDKPGQVDRLDDLLDRKRIFGLRPDLATISIPLMIIMYFTIM